MANLEVNFEKALDSGEVITAKVTNDAGTERAGSPVTLSDALVPKKFIGNCPTMVNGDTIQYFLDSTLITSETYLPEVTTENEIEAAAIIAALKAEDSWLTASGSGSLTFQQIIAILTAWAAGKVVDSGVAGTYNVLDPEDNSTVILTVTPSETTPYKDTDIS